MKSRSIITAAALVLIGSLMTDVAYSHQRPAAGNAHNATNGETVTVAADQPIPNLPGKRLVSLIVDYAPGGSTGAHRHPGSAFIYAYVLSGEIRSKVDDEPARVYRAGEAWFENPGAHHRVSANASKTKPARLLAVFIVDAAEEQLVNHDDH
jgi:quercetin dioxygenase-like cupin family protein